MRSVLKEDDVDTHSITCTQTHAQAWKDFNLEITLHIIFIPYISFVLVWCRPLSGLRTHSPRVWV